MTGKTRGLVLTYLILKVDGSSKKIGNRVLAFSGACDITGGTGTNTMHSARWSRRLQPTGISLLRRGGGAHTLLTSL